MIILILLKELLVSTPKMHLSSSLIAFALCVFCFAFSMPPYKYEMNIVGGEFIINYLQYSPLQSRHQFLTILLNPLHLNYSILDRWYPPSHQQDKLSDFDVIKVFNLNEDSTLQLIQYLSNADNIKSVTTQKQINRVLLNYDDNERAMNHPGNSNNLNFGRNLSLFGDSKGNALDGTLPLDHLKQPWKLLNAEYAWSRGLCGNGVRVGIFDTGLASPDHPHFLSSNIVERTDWTVDMGNRSYSTDDIPALDRHGHGTYVAGLIAAQNPNIYYSDSDGSFSEQRRDTTCPPLGFAPRADLFIFRVFTDAQISYTSWFLDAFNYAISRKLHVINLSIGGPDFLDKPFVDKVLELSANGILLVSAIGNDGPLFGTLNNPADQMDVLGVGGVDALGRVAQFSSRGMTGWELPTGYGRVKPDIVTFSTGVISSNLDGKCRVLSGTSVASPIVTGVVILLINAAVSHNLNLMNGKNRNGGYVTISSNSSNNNNSINQIEDLNSFSSHESVPINPISIKQALIASANTLDSVHVFGTSSIKWLQERDQSSIFEQGAGLVNVQSALEIVQRMKPQASLIPSYLDLTKCPYMWPYCSQPLYSTMRPIIFNVTILNSMHVIGRISQIPIYHPFINHNGHRLHVGVSYSSHLWPWVGYLAVHLSVAPDSSNDSIPSSYFSGIAEGYVSLVVESYDHIRNQSLITNLRLPIRANIIPTPDRSKRILFDQFHSIHYPFGFIPRDDLTRSKEPLDWLGDHIHTNFLDLYTHLRKRNYFIEVLTSSFDCFNAFNYGTLILIDPEEEFHPQEVKKLFIDVMEYGLSLIVFADWYNTSVMHSLRFFDTNTRRVWSPDTGGSNLPGLNDLLEPFGIELGDSVFAGNYVVGRRTVSYHSGTSIKRFPVQNIANRTGRAALLKSTLVDIGDQFIQHFRQGDPSEDSSHKSESEQSPSLKNNKLMNSEPNLRLKSIVGTDPTPCILGLWTPIEDGVSETGRLAIYGDSDCLSSTHLNSNCFWLLDALLQFSTSSMGRIPTTLMERMSIPNATYWFDPSLALPRRIQSSQLNRYSNVIRREWNPYNLTSNRLPSKAYRPVQSCYVAAAAPVMLDKTTPNESSLYRPQRLLLYPLEAYQALKKAYTNQYCHSSLSDDRSSLVNIRFKRLQSVQLFLKQSNFYSFFINHYLLFYIFSILTLFYFFHKHFVVFIHYIIKGVIYSFGSVYSMVKYFVVRFLLVLYSLYRKFFGCVAQNVFDRTSKSANAMIITTTTTVVSTVPSLSTSNITRTIHESGSTRKPNIFIHIHR